MSSTMTKAEGAPGRRILVADDDDLSRKRLVRYAESRGCEVDVVTNGWDALLAIGGRRYDLVVMDSNMPLLNGLEATRKIREIERAHKWPSVVIVGVTSAQNAPACRESGMDDCICKPAQADEVEVLLSQFQRFLD